MDLHEPLTGDDVVAAARRLAGVAHVTPVVTSRTLDALTGARVFLKCENFQRGGAFKFRGAYNRLAQFTGEQKRGGAIAFSSGNHAQGVALAGRLLDIDVTIVMPSDAPPAKIDATRGYGATIVFYERHGGDREALTLALQAERGGTLVPPFDDPAVVAGAGTAAAELIAEVGELDLLLVCLGGGGLLAGSCIAMQTGSPAAEIFGVEPEAGDDWVQSLVAGERVAIAVPQTLADGAMTTAPGALTFPIVQRYASGVVTVGDRALCDAMRFAFERLKIVVEPTGALALAALLGNKVKTSGRRIGITISGGNVAEPTFAACLARGRPIA